MKPSLGLRVNAGAYRLLTAIATSARARLWMTQLRKPAHFVEIPSLQDHGHGATQRTCR